MTTLKYEPPPDRLSPRLLLLAGVAATVIVIGVVWLSRPAPTPVAPPAETAAADQPTTAPEPMEPVAPLPSPVEQDWGIRVSKLALAREGSAIDLRYEIVDPDKAGLLADGTNVAYLVHTASGAEIQLTASPQEQAFRGTTRAHSLARSLRMAGEFPPPAGRIVPGKTYSALLPNPAGVVKPGNKMAFVVGKARVDNLVVE